VSEWGLGYHENQELGAAGDMGHPFKERSTRKIPLLMLPVKVRQGIWSRLENKDILALRAVSTELQNEMDHEYGLPIIMDTTNESVHFTHYATTRSCFVTKLDNLLYFNFFPEPEKLKHLRFRHDLPLTTEPLDYILRKFTKLQTISFCNKNQLRENRDGKMQLVVPTETKQLLDMISNKGSVFGVELKYNSPTSGIEWKLELKDVKESPAGKVDVGYINLDMPGEAVHHQKDALAFLDEQRHLFELRSQLVGLDWSCYTGVLRKNSGSLIGLHLLSLKCRMDEPFDCGCLSACAKLKFLSISGENSFVNTNIGGFGFIPVIHANTLASLKNLATVSLEKVHLTKVEFTSLQDNYKVWVRISQSMIEKQEVIELKFGLNAYFGYNDELDQDEDYDDYFDNDNNIEENHSILKTFLCDVQPALIKGLLITAWLTFC